MALGLACVLQGSARGAGRRYRDHRGVDDRLGAIEQRDDVDPGQRGIGGHSGLRRADEPVGPTIADPSKLISLSSANNNTGNGQIQRNEAVALRLAGVVTQVLPNGNLVVVARQEFVVNSELRELKVTGVIRPQDIASDNTVLHDRMAEARIQYGGRGEVTDLQTTRWGQQLMDILLPF